MGTEQEQGSKDQKVVYYEDSYTRSVTLPETPFFPEINFTYRPLNMVQTARLTDEILSDKSVEVATEANLKMLGRHIVDWDLRKPSGDKINPENVAELKKCDPSVVNKIVGIIRGDKKAAFEDVKELDLKNS